MNLLKETLEAIKLYGQSPKGIIFIGSEKSGYQCKWSEFKALADVEYYPGCGLQEVAGDLIIAFGDGGKMWRDEYCGMEWWEYSKPFEMPKESKKIECLVSPSGGWLEHMNSGE